MQENPKIQDISADMSIDILTEEIYTLPVLERQMPVMRTQETGKKVFIMLRSANMQHVVNSIINGFRFPYPLYGYIKSGGS